MEDSVHLLENGVDSSDVRATYETVVDEDEQDDSRKILGHEHTRVFRGRFKLILCEEVGECRVPDAAGLTKSI